MTANEAGESHGSSFFSTIVFFIVAFFLIFGAFSVGRKVNVDENVFIASAALFSRGLMLYRDYHYNHMPTLVILYAGLFKITDYFLLAARSVSAICAAGTATIFFHIANRSLKSLKDRRRMWLSLGIGMFYLINPLVTRTAGRAWNHDFPVFFSLLAFMAMSRGLAKRQLVWMAVSGLCVGLAVTTRLTFATELLPFAVFVLIYPNIRFAQRISLLGAFTFGCIIATIPTIWVWTQSPTNAYFGNFQYPALNTKWHWLHDNDVHHRDTIPAKLLFFLFNTGAEMPGNGILIILFVGFSIAAMRKQLGNVFRAELVALILLATSQLAAGLVPSPPFFQYFFAVTPFMFLAMILCFGKLPGLAADRSKDWIWIVFLAICLPFGVVEYRGLPRLFWVPDWWPVQTHEINEQIASDTGPCKVLTLDPIYVLEDGLNIYPATATGCFGMRVGDYLTPQKRQQFKMWGTDEVRDLFATDPPKAVMISPGSDDQFESLFTQLAQQHGYRLVNVKAKNPAIILWIAPQGESSHP